MLEFEDIILIHTTGFKLVFVPSLAGFLLDFGTFTAPFNGRFNLAELVVERADDFLPIGILFHARFERLLFLIFEPEFVLMFKLF